MDRKGERGRKGKEGRKGGREEGREEGRGYQEIRWKEIMNGLGV